MSPAAGFNVKALEARAKRDRWVSHLRRDLNAYGIRAPELVEEHQFLADRRFRFDFALPNLRMGIEIEGGVHADPADKIEAAGGMLFKREGKKSRHTTSDGYERDCTKYNLAQMDGWWVLRFTPRQIERGDAVTFVVLAILRRREGR